jgi:hypothetical protein
MILVNFKGHGEWFVRDGDSIKLDIPRKLAIARKTRDPFEDPLEWKPPKPYGPYSDDYLDTEDDNDEIFYENKHTFPDKNYQYDRDLRGIFIRDPNIRGKVYDTNGLCCFGADRMVCPPERGVFRLSDDDEEDFRIVGFDPKTDWDKFKERIKILLPCSHPQSAFIKKVNDGELLTTDIGRVYFEIQRKYYFDFFRESTPIEQDCHLDFVSMDSASSSNNGSVSENDRRLASLRSFIQWLKREAEKNNEDIDEKKLNCTKEELLKFLKEWERKRNNSYDWVWDTVKSWDSCNKLWNSEERKEICNTRGPGAPSKNANTKNIFKKYIGKI